jgi:Protein of unknown function (DUF1353)
MDSLENTESNNGSFIHKRKGGYFDGAVIAQWLDNDVKSEMRLLKDFTYVDLKGHYWTAPEGTITDGASIPQYLYSIVGSPYEGDYREAAVIHDWLCATKTITWQKTHKLFREMLIISHVPFWKRQAMFFAVWYFGPRW